MEFSDWVRVEVKILRGIIILKLKKANKICVAMKSRKER